MISQSEITTKEELEASNKELRRVNAELLTRLEDLRQSEERFRILVSTVKDYAIFMLDPDGRATTWNAGAEQIKGYKEDEILGHHFSIFYEPSAIQSQHPQEELKLAIRDGRYEEEGVRVRKDGSRFLAHVTITALFSPEGKLRGFAKVTRDITDRKNMERLENEKRAAEIANRSKSAFLANMSHEIRTPLTAIVGFAEFLEMTPDASEETVEFVGAIKRNAKHLSSLVSEILDLSKIEANQMDVVFVPVQIQSVIQAMLAMLRLNAEAKGLTLNVQYDTPVPETILTDPTRLNQILINIVGNAIKFTDRGSINISIGLTEPHPQDSRSLIRFEIADTGSGIAPQHHTKIFERFEQAESSITRTHGGTGLGLALSRQLAELLGGDVTLKQSELGKGSKFEITIDPGSLDGVPMRRPGVDDGFISSEANRQSHKVLQGLNVLLAEDTVDNQVIFKRMLKNAGASVRIANNGEEAVRIAKTEPFDIILMDMKMPRLNGSEATLELRGMDIKTPIIAITAHATKEEREKSLTAGCNDYLSKPVSVHDLCNVLEKWGRL